MCAKETSKFKIQIIFRILTKNVIAWNEHHHDDSTHNPDDLKMKRSFLI
jgi:hypothetical protein